MYKYNIKIVELGLRNFFFYGQLHKNIIKNRFGNTFL